MSQPDPKNLLIAVQSAICYCLAARGNPTELWLGPTEQKLFERAITQMSELHNIANPIFGKESNGLFKYGGMTVRFMERDGIRVGQTFEP